MITPTHRLSQIQLSPDRVGSCCADRGAVESPAPLYLQIALQWAHTAGMQESAFAMYRVALEAAVRQVERDARETALAALN